MTEKYRQGKEEPEKWKQKTAEGKKRAQLGNNPIIRGRKWLQSGGLESCISLITDGRTF